MSNSPSRTPEPEFRLKSDRPGLKVILTSGYSADLAGRNLELLPGEEFLQKPFAPERLLEVLRQCLNARPRTDARDS